MIERFPDNARVVFLGDSITAMNRHVARIFDYYLTHFPKSNVKFYNCGVPGGTCVTAKTYLDTDFWPHDPTHVVFMLAINDSAYTILKSPDTPERAESIKGLIENFKSRYTELVELFLSRGLKVTLCTPPCYAEFQSYGNEPLPGGNAHLLPYITFIRRIAREKGLPLVDMHGRTSEYYLNEKIYCEDRVHPVEAGFFHMTECFLEAQGLFDLGEFKPQLSEGVEAWHKLVDKERDIWSTEWNMFHFTGMEDKPLDEKFAYVRDYLEKNPDPNDYMHRIGESYLAGKEKQAELRKEVDRQMESLWH